MISKENGEAECLGYAVKVEKDGNENSYFIQNFKFKFNSKNRDSTQFGYSKLKKPTIKTNKDSYIRKRPLNPIPIFNSIQVSSSAAAILQFGSPCVSAAFSAHHLNRHTDPSHSALLTGLKS